MEDKKMEDKKEETITMNKSTLYMFAIGILSLLLVASIFTQGFGIVKAPGSGTYVPNPSPTQVPSPTPAPSQVPAPTAAPAFKVTDFMDDDVKIGKDTAQVVIVEFFDFQCLFCRKFYTETFKQIERDYINTGKVQVVYRDFPLSFHPMAQKSAEAAECADEQGKFKEFHDALFDMQMVKDGGVVASTVQYTIDDIKSVAKGISGVDAAKFNTCLDSGKYASEVQNDIAAGGASFVEGTPAFLIGKRNGEGTVLSGAYPYETFKQIIEAQLAG